MLDALTFLVGPFFDCGTKQAGEMAPVTRGPRPKWVIVAGGRVKIKQSLVFAAYGTSWHLAPKLRLTPAWQRKLRTLNTSNF